MEPNAPVISKRIWGIVRVIYFMLRKGISKRKLLLDLNLMLKRGNKIATKAIGNLIFHHHTISSTPPSEYEFSCSNTPNYSLPFHLNKRRHHNHNHHSHNHTNFFGCAFQEPPTQDDDVATMSAVKLALEMLNSNNSNYNVDQMVVPVEASPMLPGFGKSPLTVRQLRITDSPFPLRSDEDDDNGVVDKKAGEFIEKFYKQLRQQRSTN